MIKLKVNKKHSIDLQSSQGNAFYIMGIAKSILKELNKNGVTQYLDTNKNTMVSYPSEKEIMSEFMASNYENLINTFDKYFGQYCDLEK